MTVNEDCASAIPNSLRRKLFWRMSMIRGLFFGCCRFFAESSLGCIFQRGKAGILTQSAKSLAFLMQVIPCTLTALPVTFAEHQ
jgi:hypothetical protein